MGTKLAKVSHKPWVKLNLLLKDLSLKLKDLFARALMLKDLNLG